MSRIRTVFCVALILAVTASNGFAQQTYAEGTKQTQVTFSGPVQIPGVTLPAGTYHFRTPTIGAPVVQIFSQDGSRIYASVLTIPNERTQSTESTVMMFAEQPPGSPVAIKVWFYPGNMTGDEFVYPRTQAVALAKANRTTVPSYDDRTATVGSDGDRLKSLTEATVARVDETGRTITSSGSDRSAASTTASPASTTASTTANTATTAASTTTAPASTVASTATTTADRPVGTGGQAPAPSDAPVTAAPRPESSQTFARNDASANAPARRDQLPSTASRLGEMAGLGAVLLIAGLALSLARARSSR